MPVSRFSDIKKSNKLSEAYTKFKVWQDRPYDPKPNTRGASKTTLPVYLHPFSVPLVIGEFYASKTDPATYADLSALVNGTSKADVTDSLGTSTVVSSGGFSAARLIWFRNTTRVVSTPISEITGLSYLKYSGSRLSIPFGQKTGTDEEIQAFRAVKAACLGVSGFAVSRVSLKREWMKS